MKRNENLPMHVQFFLPLLAALKQLGGSGNLTEIKDTLVEMLKITETELEDRLKNGASRIDNQITWSKIYLTRAKLVDDSERNLLTLTEKGYKADLTEDDVVKIFKEIHAGFIAQGKKVKDPGEGNGEDPPTENHEIAAELLSLLQSLSPDGFERLCQRLLRASGFTKVIVTGRAGDGGIDGEGILEINPLVSLKVIFQAKRYKGPVSSSQIRDFRGAMQGRAEKGIILTTGGFTQDAKKEAFREGVPPIELVDGDKLIQLFIQNKLGLKARVVYEIDQEFFTEYQISA